MSSAFFIVPGNHDVDRSSLRNPLNRLLHDELRRNWSYLDEAIEHPDTAATLVRKFENYASFVKGYGAAETTAEAPWWSRRILTALGEVVLVGLNTALLSTDDSDSNRTLALGKKVLHQAIQAQPETLLCVVLQHHPPEWLADGSELRAWLKARPHLMFSGHVHEQAGAIGASFGGGGLIEIAAGAAHGESEGEHGYTWLMLGTSGLQFLPRVWSRSRKSFVPDKNNFDGMDEGGRLLRASSDLPLPIRRWLATTRPVVLQPEAEAQRSQTADATNSFRQRVAALLRLRGHAVEDGQADRTDAPLTVIETSGLLPRQLAVFCIESSEPIDRRAYERMASRLNHLRASSRVPLGGMLISSVGFAKGLAEEAVERDLRLVRISELEQGLIDFKPYLAHLLNEFEGYADLAHFIEPKLVRENRELPERKHQRSLRSG